MPSASLISSSEAPSARARLARFVTPLSWFSRASQIIIISVFTPEQAIFRQAAEEVLTIPFPAYLLDEWPRHRLDECLSEPPEVAILPEVHWSNRFVKTV